MSIVQSWRGNFCFLYTKDVHLPYGRKLFQVSDLYCVLVLKLVPSLVCQLANFLPSVQFYIVYKVGSLMVFIPSSTSLCVGCDSKPSSLCLARMNYFTKPFNFEAYRMREESKYVQQQL